MQLSGKGRNRKGLKGGEGRSEEERKWRGGEGSSGLWGTHFLQTSKSFHRMLRSFRIVIVQKPLQVEEDGFISCEDRQCPLCH